MCSTHPIQTSVQTGQHEPVTFDQNSQSQSDLSEGSGEEAVTPRVCQQLRHQNLLLAQQLQEREVERNRLREQLEIHLQKVPPPGLPFKVLDGRPVIHKETVGGREMRVDKAGSSATRAEDTLVESLQNQIDQLSQEKKALQQVLEGDKMALQAEVERQREAITKLKERKDDLTQNVAVLTYENSHQNGTIGLLKEDNFMLHTSLETSMRQVRSLEESYAAVRRENTELRAEVQRLTNDRLLLAKEKDQLRKNMLFTDVKKDVKQELVERAELKEKLSRAEQEIRTLREQLDKKRAGEEARERTYTELSAKLGEVSDELQSTRELVAGLETQRREALRESFAALVQKLGEKSKASPQTNLSQMKAMLQMSNDTVKQLKKEVDHLTCENALMTSQKAGLLVEVQKLKALVGELRSQKEQLESQVAKGKSLLEEKEVMLKDLKEERVTSQSAQAAKEREWKEQMGKIVEEWRVKVERVEEEKEVVLKEQEMQSLQKEGLEGQVTHLKATNDQLMLQQQQLVQCNHTLEAKVADLVTTVAEKDSEIAATQKTVADLKAERSRMAAKLEEAETEIQRGVRLRMELEQTLQSSQTEASAFKETLSATQAASNKLQTQILEQSTQVEELCKKVSSLTDEKVKVCVENEDLQRKLTDALKDLQEVKEAGLARTSQCENMIKELKVQVTSLEQEKEGLEEKLAEHTEVSAFRKIPENKLKQKISTLQQENRLGKRGPAEMKDLVQRLSDAEACVRSLELENQQLKKSVLAKEGGAEPPSTSSLQRQLAEVKMKLMFAEKERDDTMERLRQLLASQKAGHKDSGRLQEVQEENLLLQNRVKSAEERHKKETAIFGDRLKRAVKENDQLRHRLTTLVSSISGNWGETGIEKAGEELRTEVKALEGLKTTLSACRVELVRLLERNQQQMMALERDLQGAIISPGGRETPQHARRTVSATLPPVLMNLPPGVLSSFQGAVTPPRYPTPTPPDQSPSGSSSEPQAKVMELHPKVAELRSQHAALAAEIQGKVVTLHHSEEVLEMTRNHLVTLSAVFQKLVFQEKEMRDAVAKVKDLDLPQGQLQLVQMLEKKVTMLEDQVYDRDAALQEINQQMNEDYKTHNQKFTNLMSQIKELREKLLSCNNRLKVKEKFIQDSQVEFTALEAELWTAKKELEQLTQERDQLVSQCVAENAKVSGFLGVKEYLRSQKEELDRAQKAVNEFKFVLRQLQSQLEAVQRDKGALELKSVEVERMHIHMKEAVNNEIAHLRHLNLVLVEQQLKGLDDEKIKELMTVVKETQEAQQKHKEAIQLETQLDATLVSLQEEQYKNSQLEQKVNNQEFLIKIYETDKGNSRFVGSSGGRPRSAEVPRMGFRIAQNRQTITHVPEQNHFVVEVGKERVDLQDLQPGSKKNQEPLRPLGPAVETDDEQVVTNPPLRNAFKPRHRRTASDSSSVQDSIHHGFKPHTLRKPDSAGSTSESVRISTPISKMLPEALSTRDSISSVAQDISQQVAALSQAIVAPELPSWKDRSDSSSKSGSSDMTPTLKHMPGHSQGLKMAPPSRAKEQASYPESSKVLRTDSMSSSSVISRDTSFSQYDGSESSSQSLSHESLEVTNQLLQLPANGFQAISESFSDDDVTTLGRGRQWDRNACETPHVKESSFSSCDSEVHHQRQTSQPIVPVHRVESICLSEMDCGTDSEHYENVKQLARMQQIGKPLGKVKSSSTGSIKVCYGEESSNTSMEDVRGKK